MLGWVGNSVRQLQSGGGQASAMRSASQAVACVARCRSTLQAQLYVVLVRIEHCMYGTIGGIQGGWDAGQASAMRTASQAVATIGGIQGGWDTSQASAMRTASTMNCQRRSGECYEICRSGSCICSWECLTGHPAGEGVAPVNSKLFQSLSELREDTWQPRAMLKQVLLVIETLQLKRS